MSEGAYNDDIGFEFRQLGYRFRRPETGRLYHR
jgi:hypothetical protein